MFIRKSEKKGIITLGILTMALFVLPQTIHKSECPIFLIPYSRLSDTTQPVTLKHLVIELNSADSTTLIGVRGIGPYYAKKFCVTGNNWAVSTLHVSLGKSNSNT